MSATARRRWSASGALGSIRPCSFSAAAPRYPTSRPSPRGYCHRCHRAGRRGSCSLTRPQHRPARGRRTTLGATSPAMPIQSLGHRRPCAAAAPVSRWRIQCSRCIDAGRHAPHDEARRAQWVQVGGARGLKLREAGVCRRCLVSPINRSFVRSFVSNVVVWKTILYDPAAKLCSLSASGRSSRRVAPTTTTRSAPPCELPSKRQRWRCSVCRRRSDQAGPSTWAAARHAPPPCLVLTSCTIQSLGLRTPPLHGTARPKVAC